MSVTPQELRDRAAIMNGNSPDKSRKTENVVKFFMDKDKIEAIKAQDTRIVVGSPPTPIVIRPMTPLGIAKSYSIIRKLLVPVINVVAAQEAGRPLSLQMVLEAFGDNVELLPELIFNIIQRGNPDITREWCDEHLDFMLDIQLILPLFLEQNGLDRLFSGKKSAEPVAAATPQPTEIAPKTEESQAPSTSVQDGTEPQLVTTGTT